MPDGMPNADFGQLKIPKAIAPGNTGEQPNSQRTAATYELLSQTHDEYDPELLRTFDDLYEGGFRMRRSAQKYAPAMGDEHPSRYEGRCKKTSYQPYFGQIVNEFVSEVFEQPLTIAPPGDADNPDSPGESPDKEFYDAFAQDTDTKQTSFTTLLGDVLCTALQKKYGYVHIDAPTLSDGEPPPVSRAQEKEAGKDRVYAYELPVESIIDWRTEGDGFSFCIVHTSVCERKTPFSKRDHTTETWMVWEMTDDGFAAWSKYEITYLNTKPPQPTTVIPLAGEGVTSFKQIPILRLELTHGMWVGNKIGTQAIEHFARRCELVAAESDSCYAIPCVFLGPEIGAQGGALPSEKQQDPGRDKNPVKELKRRGWASFGSDDRVEMVEPAGGAYEIVTRDLDALKDSMFSVSHQMAASVRPTAAVMGRSGASKQEDGKSTTKVLRALGEILRKFGTKIYKAISDARGEDVKWQAHGLDSYEVDDREQVLEEAISIGQVDIPSETFKRTHAYQVAMKILKGAPPETLSQIKKEIDAGISQKMAHDKLADETEEEQMLAKQKVAGDTQKGVPPPTVKPPMANRAKAPMAKGPPQPGAAMGAGK